MAHSAYAALLKHLLAFTDTKYTALSEAIDYDMSYISKWVNGARLPASRHIDRVNQDMARFFAGRAAGQKREDALRKEFQLPLSASGEELVFQLYNLFNEAYHQTVKASSKENVRTAEIRLVTGRAACREALGKLLQEHLGKRTQQGEMIITGRFDTLEKNGFWKLLKENSGSGHACNIHLGLQMAAFQAEMPASAAAFYHCLDELLAYNFTLHEIKREAYHNIIVLKDGFAAFYYLDPDGYMDLCTLVTAEKQVAEIYNKCCSFMMVQPVLIEPKWTLGMDRFGYRDIFFTSDHYLFFLTNGLEFLLPDEVYDSLCRLIDQGKYPTATKEWVHRIQDLWYQIIEQGQMKIIMPKKSIIRYLETGFFYLTDMNYQMTPKERRDQLALIIEKMKQNPQLTAGMLLPDAAHEGYADFTNLAFYGNYTAAFFKKNTHQIGPESQPIYLLDSPELIRCMHDYFDGLTKEARYKEFSAANVGELRRLVEPLLCLLTEEKAEAAAVKPAQR